MDFLGLLWRTHEVNNIVLSSFLEFEYRVEPVKGKAWGNGKGWWWVKDGGRSGRLGLKVVKIKYNFFVTWFLPD